MDTFEAKVDAIRKLVNKPVRDEDAIQAAYEKLSTNAEKVRFQTEYPDLFNQVTTPDAVKKIQPGATAPPGSAAMAAQADAITKGEVVDPTVRGGRHRRRGKKTAKKTKGKRKTRRGSKSRRH